MPASTDIPSTDSTDLMVAAKIIGKECSKCNKDFLVCKSKNEDPTDCLADGERVTACLFNVLRTLDEKCGDQFAKFKKAMNKNFHRIDSCRKEEAEMLDCWRSFKKPSTTN